MTASLTYNLQLHRLSIELNRSNLLDVYQHYSTGTQDMLRPKRDHATYEVNANGGDVGLGIGVVGKSQKQAGLSHAGVTNEQKLEEVIVSEPAG